MSHTPPHFLLSGETVILTGSLAADGGRAPIFGGGGGGRIRIDSGTGGFHGDVSRISVNGGDGWYASESGTITFTTQAVPEPASVALLGLGLDARRRSR